MSVPTTPTLKTVAALDYTSDLVQYVDPNNQLLAKIDHTGAFSTSSGSGDVNSVFGRGGTVVATTGDYSVAQVTGAATAASVTAETARAEAAEALLAPKASPTFTGTVTLPILIESATLSPTSAGTAGVTGQIAWDGANIYVCTAGGGVGAATWMAAALSAV